MTEPTPPPAQAQLDYAVAWFVHHATQRLQTFNFYLVIVTVLLVGYGTSLHDKSRWFAALLCGVGLLVTFLFFQLEVRNAELVSVGREALSLVEAGAAMMPLTVWAHDRRFLAGAIVEGRYSGADSAPAPRRAEWNWRREITRHAFVLRFVMLAGAGLFLVGLVLALFGLVPGDHAAVPVKP